MLRLRNNEKTIFRSPVDKVKKKTRRGNMLRSKCLSMLLMIGVIAALLMPVNSIAWWSEILYPTGTSVHKQISEPQSTIKIIGRPMPGNFGGLRGLIL